MMSKFIEFLSLVFLYFQTCLPFPFCYSIAMFVNMFGCFCPSICLVRTALVASFVFRTEVGDVIAFSASHINVLFHYIAICIYIELQLIIYIYAT